jgi:hypothetical protein
MLAVESFPEIDYLPYFGRLQKLHQQAGQQPDNLCGPYWVALLLNAYGQRSVSLLDVAISASSVVPGDGNPGDWLPPGTKSCWETEYDCIPTTTDTDAWGTSITGLMEATETLSEGQFCLMPLRTTDWETGLQTILALCQNNPDRQLVPLLNVHTSYFWGSQPAQADIQAYLDGSPITPAPADWSVGHFALLAGQLQGKAKALYAVLDTYPHFGWDGLHLQPPAILAQSLIRLNQTFEGGISLFVAKDTRSHLEPQLTDAGFKITPWDNGSPCPNQS